MKDFWLWVLGLLSLWLFGNVLAVLLIASHTPVLLGMILLFAYGWFGMDALKDWINKDKEPGEPITIDKENDK